MYPLFSTEEMEMIENLAFITYKNIKISANNSS